MEGGAPRRLTSVPASPRFAGARPSLFLLAESGTGRFKRHNLRHIPARRFYRSLITILLTVSAAESDALSASEDSSASVSAVE